MTTDSENAEQVRLIGEEPCQKRIIVVEDDSDFRESLVETLLLHGYDAIGAKSALDFYQKVSQKPYALVILDLGLPDQNGVVLAEFIRQNTRMRIVVLTARSSLESRVAAYKAGADTYLLKPVDTTELIATVESNLGRLCPEAENDPESVTPSLASSFADWHVLRADALLITPSGKKISLSSKELDFLELLASNNERHVSRNELIEALGYEEAKLGSQALDVVIHRLRQKAADMGVRLPIKTVRGKGFAATEPIKLQHQDND